MKNKLYTKQKQEQIMTLGRAVVISAITSSGVGLVFAMFLFFNVGGIKDTLAATDLTYYSRGNGDWKDKDTWSTAGYDGGRAASIPGAGDVVYIQGFDVRIKRNQKCKELHIIGSPSKTTFTIAAKKALEVSGDINIDMKGDSKSLSLFVDQDASLKAEGNFNVVGEGSSWSYLWFDGGKFSVGKNVNLTSRNEAGIMLYIYGNGTAEIGGDVNLEQNGTEALVSFKQNNKSVATIDGDINFHSNAASKAAFLLTASSVLKLKGNINRNEAPGNFGLFSAKDDATLELAGSKQQRMAGSAGAGSDGIYYNNIKINNSFASSPQVKLEGTIYVKGSFSFQRGVIETTEQNQIAFGPNGSFAESKNSNYVMGGNESESTGNTTQPVELLTYDVKVVNNDVVVAWATASELNNDYFTIERSSDGTRFNHLTTVKGAGTTRQTKKYAFLDKNPLPGTSYYQLSQTDLSGGQEAFPVKWVNVNTNMNTEPLTLKEIGPNPFVSQFSLSYRAESEAPVNLSLMDLNGRLLHATTIKGERGANAYTFSDGASLESGIYFLVLEQNGAKVTRKIVKRS